MRENSPILSCRNLIVGYGKTRVLKDLNLDFFPGEFVSLLGPNGVGKTTLLRTLSRHLPLLAGKICLKGTDLNTISSQNLASTMSVVLTQKIVPPLFQVYEFVAMGRYPHTSWTGRLDREDDAAVSRALALVRAQDLMFRDLDTLSDGEKQKVFIARALAQEPSIILLDEPTIHLDLKHRMEIMAILQELCREKKICVVASLHDLEVAAKVSDRVALIREKSVWAFGPPEDVLNQASVSELYDFSNACFCPMLGNIEIQSRADHARVFVVGGMGSGTVLYRLLAKRGYDIVTGVLMKNDIDHVVASSLGAWCLTQTDPAQVSPKLVSTAMDALESCDLVVDTGFKTNLLNQANLELLDRALVLGKPVFAMDCGQGRKGYKTRPDQVWSADRETGLVDLMEVKLQSQKRKMV